jgi:hypothetical protein
MTSKGGAWLRSNWFVVAVPPLLLIEWLVARNIGGEMGPYLETVVLFDLCLFMPALYIACYWRSVALKPLILRTIALVCVGIYLSTYLVPAAAQQVLPHLFWARIAGLIVLALVELRLLVMAVRMIYGRNASAEQVSAASGAPPWIARLMVLEARFWRTVWRLVRRR